MKTTAVREGDGWVLNGTKMFITQGTVGDVFVVLAVTDAGEEAEGHHRLHPREGHARVSASAPSTASSACARRTPRSWCFEDVEVPDDAAARRGRPRLHRHAEDPRQRPHHHRRAGGGPGPRARSRSRCATRKDRTPSASRSPSSRRIRWMLADMKTELDAARLLVHRAAASRRRGPAVHPGGVDGEALRVRGGHARVQQGGADPRRLRLHAASSRSSATCATPSCARSARAPARSSARSSPAKSSEGVRWTPPDRVCRSASSRATCGPPRA